MDSYFAASLCKINAYEISPFDKYIRQVCI